MNNLSCILFSYLQIYLQSYLCHIFDAKTGQLNDNICNGTNAGYNFSTSRWH